MYVLKNHMLFIQTLLLCSLYRIRLSYSLFFFFRFDGHLIDARNITVDHKNPYAVGHKINHIPPFGVPNVVQVPFDFTDDPFGLDCFPVELRKYIPNKLFQERTMLGSPDR